MQNKIEKLHLEFKFKGGKAREYLRQCIGMLPEIYKLRVYEAKGFISIYEYAAKLAGISRLQVDTVLRLERRFENKPELKKALVSGEVSHHKLARVASIATEENDGELAFRVKHLTQKAVETLVRDEKQNGFGKSKYEQKSLRVQTLELDGDVEEKLLEMQEKGIDINTFLREVLAKRDFGLEQEEKILSEESKSTNSRYIPAKVKKYLVKVYGKKCSIKGCNRCSVSIHHTQRFGLSRTHDPRYMAPLCRQHHEIAHSIDLKYAQKRLS